MIVVGNDGKAYVISHVTVNKKLLRLQGFENKSLHSNNKGDFRRGCIMVGQFCYLTLIDYSLKRLHEVNDSGVNPKQADLMALKMKA